MPMTSSICVTFCVMVPIASIRSPDAQFIELDADGREPPKTYQRVAAAASQIATPCAQIAAYQKALKSMEVVPELAKYQHVDPFASLCGPGSGPNGVAAWVDAVWENMQLARSAVEEQDDVDESTMRVYVGPEWVFRRYGGSSSPRPFTPAEFEQIVQTLAYRMWSDGGWTDWLVVPGSIYWGFQIRGLATFIDERAQEYSDNTYAVFNTAPVFAGGSLVTLYSKNLEADYLSGADVGSNASTTEEASAGPKEVWGNSLINELASSTKKSRKDIGDLMLAFAQSHESAERTSHILSQYGLIFASPFIVFGSRLIGIEICADHANKHAHDSLAKVPVNRFDLLLLVSGGMVFDFNNLRLRHGGMALRSDGVEYGARFVQVQSMSPYDSSQRPLILESDVYDEADVREMAGGEPLSKNAQSDWVIGDPDNLSAESAPAKLEIKQYEDATGTHGGLWEKSRCPAKVTLADCACRKCSDGHIHSEWCYFDKSLQLSRDYHQHVITQLGNTRHFVTFPVRNFKKGGPSPKLAQAISKIEAGHCPHEVVQDVPRLCIAAQPSGDEKLTKWSAVLLPRLLSQC